MTYENIIYCKHSWWIKISLEQFTKSMLKNSRRKFWRKQFRRVCCIMCAFSCYMILKWNHASNFHRKNIHIKLLPCCTGVSGSVVKVITTLLRPKYNVVNKTVYNKSINVGLTHKFKQTHNIRSSSFAIIRIVCVDCVY